MGFLVFFPTGTYAVIGTNCVEFENIMKSAQKKKKNYRINKNPKKKSFKTF